MTVSGTTRLGCTSGRLRLLSLLALSCFAVGCSRAVVAPAQKVPVLAVTQCDVAWSKQPAEDLTARYEWIGEVILEPSSDEGIASEDRELVEERACSIGGELLTLTTHAERKGTRYAHPGTLVFNVMRLREGQTADDLPPLPQPNTKDALPTAAAPQPAPSTP